MRLDCSLRHFSAAIALTLASFAAHATTPSYPAFVSDAQVPIPSSDGYNNPRGLAVAPGGTVYVADTGNNRVLQIAPSGVQTTVSFGTLKPALGTPGGVALDPTGNLYVTDTATNRVIKLPAGSANGIAIISGLNAPTSIAVDSSGNLAILNSGNNTITERRGGGSAALFNTGSTTLVAPTTLAFNNVGALYVGDQGKDGGNDGLYLFPKLGGTAANVTPPGVGIYLGITGIATDSAGNAYLAIGPNDAPNYLVELPASGASPLVVPTTTFYAISAIAVDNIGNLYFADAYQQEQDTHSSVNKLYYNNAANFGPSPVGTSSSAILFNFGFYQPTTIQSSQALSGGIADKEYSVGGTTAYLASNSCYPGSGNALEPSTYLGFLFPATCSLAYHFTPSGIGGRPGAIQLKTSVGTATQLTWGKGLGAQLALLNAAVTPKFTNYNIGGIIANAPGTELYFTGASPGGQFATYRVPAGSNTPTLVYPLVGQIAVNGAGDLFIFNVPTITKVPADGSPTTTIHVPGLINPQDFAMDYNGAFYITDLGPPNEDDYEGFVVRVSSTGAVSRVPSLINNWAYPTLITADYDGNIAVEDSANSQIFIVEVGTGSYAEGAFSAQIEGNGGDFPIDLAVDPSQTAFFWNLDVVSSFGNNLVFTTRGSCDNAYARACLFPFYTYPGVMDPYFGYLPLSTAPSSQGLTALSNSKMYIINGDGPGVFLIDRTFGTILPQAFNPGNRDIHGGPTQSGYVFNSGNQPLVFSDPDNIFTQTGSSVAFTMSESASSACVPGSVIQPGNYCNFNVTDTNPPATPYAIDTLHFLTNAVNNSTASFKITGPPAAN